MASAVEGGVELRELSYSGTTQVEERERDSLSNVHSQRRDDAYRQEFSLPQADGGKDAWLFLACSFLVEAVVWGEYNAIFPNSQD